MEIVPENEYERMFTIYVIIFALVSFSSFVSSITTAMTHLRNINGERNRQEEYVRRFIVDNQLTMELGNRIYSCIRQNRKLKARRVTETDVMVLQGVPESL